MTPEGRVKKMVSSYLRDLQEWLDLNGQELYYSMFVPSGYGKNNSLDYHLCIAGHFIAIETKAPGEWLNAQQRLTARNLYYSGATVWFISGPEGLAAFKRWIENNASRIVEDRGDAWGEGVIP